MQLPIFCGELLWETIDASTMGQFFLFDALTMGRFFLSAMSSDSELGGARGQSGSVVNKIFLSLQISDAGHEVALVLTRTESTEELIAGEALDGLRSPCSSGGDGGSE